MITNGEILVSIIIPTYNRKNELTKCLNSLFKQNCSEKYEIIIVDDGSTDGTEKMIEKIKKESDHSIKYIKQENQGAAAARNTGIKHAKGKYLAFIDSDCIADENWLKNCIKTISSSDDSIAGVGGKIISGINTTVGKGAHLIEFHQYCSNKRKFVRVIPTANLCLKRHIFDEVGFFDEHLRTGQDTELCWRIIKKGYKILYSPDIQVTHYGVSTIRELWKKQASLGRGFFSTRRKHRDMPPVRIPENLFLFCLILPLLYTGSVLKIMTIQPIKYMGLRLPLILPVILYGRTAFWIGSLKSFKNSKDTF